MVTYPPPPPYGEVGSERHWGADKVSHWSGQGQSKGKNYIFFPCWLRSSADGYLTDVLHSKRTYRFQGQGAVPEVPCKVQGKGQVRSPNIIIMPDI